MMLLSQIPSKAVVLSPPQVLHRNIGLLVQEVQKWLYVRVVWVFQSGMGESYRLMGEKCPTCWRTRRQSQCCLTCFCGEAVRHKLKGISSSVCGTTCCLFLPAPKKRRYLNLEDLSEVENTDEDLRDWLCAIKIKIFLDESVRITDQL